MGRHRGKLGASRVGTFGGYKGFQWVGWGVKALLTGCRAARGFGPVQIPRRKGALTLFRHGGGMPNCLRPKWTGARVFFTVCLAVRGDDTLVREVAALRRAVAETKAERPFGIQAWVVLPDHLHCVWQMPEGTGAFRQDGRRSRHGFRWKWVGRGEPRPTIRWESCPRRSLCG